MTLRGRRFRALLSRLFLLPHIVCCGALYGVCGCANSACGQRPSSSVRAPARRARAFPSRGESPRCAVTRGRRLSYDCQTPATRWTPPLPRRARRESSRPFPPRLTRRRGRAPHTAYRRYDQARPRDPTHRAPGRDPSRGSPAQTLRQTDRSGAAGGGGRAASWVLGVTCTKYCETHRAVSVPYPVSALRLWTSASSLMVRYRPRKNPCDIALRSPG